MQSCAQDTIKRYLNPNIGRLLQNFIFFLLFYLYLWLYIDLPLMFHGAGVITNFPSFYKDWPFFITFLQYPGGLIEYLSAFLSQFFYYSWAGALVVTTQAWSLYFCFDYLLKAAGLQRMREICFSVPIFLLIIYTQYTYYFTTTLALLVALASVCLYIKITSSRTKALYYLGIFLSLSIILYYLAGGAFLLFAIVCAIYELTFRFRWKTSLFYLLTAALIPYITGVLIFRVSTIDAFSKLLPFSWEILHYESRKRAVTIVYILYLLPPSTLMVLGLWQILRKRFRFSKNRKKKEPAKKTRKKSFSPPTNIFSWYSHSPKFSWAIESLLLFAIAGGVVYLARNDNLRTRFKVDYYGYHKMWPELFMSAQRNPDNPIIAHEVNRALYHRGRLGYDMFSWPQDPDYLFLSNPDYKWTHWQIFNVYLDIGAINIAENALTECLEGLGDRPMILRQLALINMVKGNLNSAKIYLSALSKTLFHAKWAKHYLDHIQTDPKLLKDQYIQHLRSLLLDKDYPTQSLPKERMLSWLLEKNSQNRMAFEYLMAWYLLNKHLGKFTQKIERLQDFGYPELPTHYEEAALIYVYGTKKPLRLSGYKPSSQLQKRIEDFSRLLNSYGRDKKAAFAELSRKYRNTYFFYYMYAPSGTKK